MDQAWAQVGQIEEANRELRWATMAREVRGSVLRRHLAPLPAAEVLAVTAAVHRRVPARTSTVAVELAASRLPDEVVSGPFRRAAGPRTALSRRILPPDQRQPGYLARVVNKLDGGAVTMGIPSRPPDGLFGFATAAPARPGVPADVVAKVVAARDAARTRQPKVLDPRRLQPDRSRSDVGRAGRNRPGPPDTPAGARAAARFHDAAAAVAGRSAAVLEVPPDPPRPALGVGDIASGLLARLDPRVTVPARIRGRIRVPDSARPRPGHDPLEEIQAAPVFAQPAWELVRDHAPQACCSPACTESRWTRRRWPRPTRCSPRQCWSASTTRSPASCCGASTRPTSGDRRSASSGRPTGPTTSRPSTPGRPETSAGTWRRATPTSRSWCGGDCSTAIRAR